MKHLEEVAEKFLSPTSDLVDGPVAFEDSFDSGAITKPKEFGTPKKFPVLADAPAAAAGFTNKGVVMTLSFGAAAGAKANRAQAGPIHSKVEGTYALGAEKGKSYFGGFRVVRLHEDPAHASTSPICFEKARERGVVAS